MMFHWRFIHGVKSSHLQFILSLCDSNVTWEINGSWIFYFWNTFFIQIGHFSKSNYLKFMKSSVKTEAYVFLTLAWFWFSLSQTALILRITWEVWPPQIQWNSLSVKNPRSPYFNKFFNRFDIRQVLNKMLFVTSPDFIFCFRIFPFW